MNRRAVRGVGAAVLVTAALSPHAAQADTTYRYWSYWIGGDTWTYSARGSGFRVPPDAGVEGYRFTVSPKDGSQASPPSTASTYEALCPGQPPAPEAQKRVALVLDFGPSGIAPVGESPPPTSVQCLTVPTAATGLQVLQQVAQLRFHTSGLICGIGGFPARECPGQTPRTVSPTTNPTVSPTANPTANPTASPTAIPTANPTANPTATPIVSVPVDPVPGAEIGTPSSSPSTSPSPTAATLSPQAAPTAVELAVGTSSPPPAETRTPAWIAAIGAGMIAALLGLALLVRRGRE